MGIIQSGVVDSAVPALLTETLAKRLEMASLNTALGLVIVFAVLISIILLIYTFKIIPYMIDRRTVRKDSDSGTRIQTELPVAEEQVQENLIDDGELVAVITAAIYASMGDEGTIPADGLIVRSIRRINARRK